MYDLKTNLTDAFGKESPVECYKLNVVAVILAIFFVLSLIQNAVLMFNFYTKKCKLTPSDLLVVYLLCINFFGIIVEFPIGIITNLKCKWIFDVVGCDLSSIVMVFVGSSSIYTMSLISYDKYIRYDSSRSFSKLIFSFVMFGQTFFLLYVDTSV